MKYFRIDEFKCICCNQVLMSSKFLEKLDKAREIAGVPFIVTSGYRCKKHNSNVSKISDSAHLSGVAADIYVKDNNHRLKILQGAIKAGFERIGIGTYHIHLDTDFSKRQDRACLY